MLYQAFGALTVRINCKSMIALFNTNESVQEICHKQSKKAVRHRSCSILSGLPEGNRIVLPIIYSQERITSA